MERMPARAFTVTNTSEKKTTMKTLAAKVNPRAITISGIRGANGTDTQIAM